MIVFAQILTYVLPSGRFDREPANVPTETPRVFVVPDGQSAQVVTSDGDVTVNGQIELPAGLEEQTPSRRVVPGSYHRVEAEPLPWYAALIKVPKGLEEAAEIIFFVLIVGGVIEIVKSTGALDAAIGAAIHHLGSRSILLAGGMMALFAVGSSTIGMSEEYLPFVPLLVSMCLALGMDALVALGIVSIGAGIGYGCAAINPFTVMIAKDIAGQQPAYGMLLRWCLLAVMLVIALHHLMRYASRIKADPSKSLVADVDYSKGYEMPRDLAMTPQRVLVLLLFGAMIIFFVWGAIKQGWYIVELAGLFLGLGLLSGLITRKHPNDLASAFTKGVADLSGTAVIIGFARTIEVVLTDGVVIDTIIAWGADLLNRAEALGAVAPVVGGWGMLAVQTICNLLVPSGSGQAYVTMPIMAPLADLTGVGRETAVLAYQFGDGLTNMLVPTNAVLMGMLLLARIPYQRWVRFIVPLLIKLYLVCLAVLAWAALGGLPSGSLGT